MSRDFAPTVYILASKRNGTLYILASKRNGTLYTGVTSDPIARWYQHRTGQVRGFTRDYGVKLLVWFEQQATMEEAILREKRIKNGIARGSLS